MKLDAKELRLIAELRGTPTGKITAVKFAGNIVAIKTELDAEISDKARRQVGTWTDDVPRGTIPESDRHDTKDEKLSEPTKRAGDLENTGEVRTQEPRR